MSSAIALVEVGPRDGFQPIGPHIATDVKIAFVEGLYRAGLRRMEVTAFVNERAVPQLSDAAEVLRAAQLLPGLAAQVLVPNKRFCHRALEAGASHIAFVLSASEKHNQNNVRRSPAESVEEYGRLVADLPGGTRVRLNLATSFDCPFDGPVPEADVLKLLDALIPLRPGVEVALCDTTGRVTPDRVRSLFERSIRRYGNGTGWAFHGHDTYGLGVANVLAAYDAGVRVFDSSFAGLGGCPFAPGATGNVATEDVVWTFNNMGLETGVDLGSLLEVSMRGAEIPGAFSGGRVRNALEGQRCVQALEG
ncbi:hydroxymethylglutaryl-CoA lyase (plasmid) [Sphingobium sp. LB126]|uniref:hydroxymethylglutaryl-CoA lyase n=1 Tax=Sphingobium sp. LB126 TaxID=1983755 RepID=UPI000C2037E6|nr:hydroxymethylglutaryl-CoA lyase [Sphingobium sp. LB126]PJG44992.1 hydroxymethylglutaryl-CoA lyase [Sphingobium sp. LB126]PJG45117.1 hydroxymethylglutaryl-CoA lyase [Sphingobium sp. LB126]